jgi:hypothetical protein
MIAVVLSEKYECQKRLAFIKSKFYQNGLNCIVIQDIWEMEKLIPFLYSIGDSPFLFLKSPWEWIEKPKEVLEFHASNTGFESVVVSDDLVTYIPSRVTVFRDTLINFKQLYNQEFYNFYAKNSQKVIDKPKYAPHIFLTTHNRHTYLELTLNSILFNICESTPITLLLNEPTEEVYKTALKFAQKRQIEILHIEKNSFYSSINLAVQWHNPETFMVFEDDFILPSTAKEYYPNWEYHFARRLQEFDLVGWSPLLDNGPTFHRLPRIESKPFGQWYYGNKKEKPLLLGNALMIRKNFWLESLKSMIESGDENKWHTPLDHTLHKNANRYCMPSLRGYHIGWNQSLDYNFKTPTNFDPPLKNTVTSINTGEKRAFNLQDIL